MGWLIHQSRPPALRSPLPKNGTKNNPPMDLEMQK
jgi:hypothetical protein